jgi:hypothetical protein
MFCYCQVIHFSDLELKKYKGKHIMMRLYLVTKFFLWGSI